VDCVAVYGFKIKHRPFVSDLQSCQVRDVSTALTLLRDTSYCYVSLQFLGLYETIVIRPSSSSSSSYNRFSRTSAYC